MPVTRSIAAIALSLATGIAGSALAGCAAPYPSIRSGDANSVEITYGGDAESAMPLARRHCSQFERVPRLVIADGDTAMFDCVRR